VEWTAVADFILCIFQLDVDYFATVVTPPARANVASGVLRIDISFENPL